MGATSWPNCIHYPTLIEEAMLWYEWYVYFAHIFIVLPFIVFQHAWKIWITAWEYNLLEHRSNINTADKASQADLDARQIIIALLWVILHIMWTNCTQKFVKMKFFRNWYNYLAIMANNCFTFNLKFIFHLLHINNSWELIYIWIWLLYDKQD